MNYYKKIVLGFIGLYIFGVAIDIFISKTFLKSNLFYGEYNVWNDILNKNVDDDLIIYGSSRSFVHINPEILDEELNVNSYNLGLNGHKIKFQKYRHDLALSNNLKPKNVIINLDINALIDVEPYSARQFLPMLFFNKYLYDLLDDSLDISKWDLFIPLIRYREFDMKPSEFFMEMYKVYMYSNYDQYKRKKGFIGNESDWEPGVSKCENIKLSVNRIQDLIDIIEDLKKINANIILINSPEYITQIESEINRQEIIDLYTKISDKYNIPFIDYSNDSINYQKDLFYNTDHLNAKGANIFTKKLVEDIKPHIKYSEVF